MGASNYGKGALEEYEIPYENNANATISTGTDGAGYIDPNNAADQTVVVGSSQGDPSLQGNPGYEVYTIPTTPQGGIGGAGYVDPNTGGAAPGMTGDYVTGAPGSGNTDLGQDGFGTNNLGKGAIESYIITSDTMIDPNTGGNAPGYAGSYVTPAAGDAGPDNDTISTIVNLTEEFLGDNTDSGKTTITEPSTSTSSTIVTSIATRAKQ